MNETPYPAFKILLVDDEEAWLRSLEITLALSGGINNIMRCSDSRNVMGILSREKVGLVLLDLNMPHISGEELLKQIIEEHPEVAVIIISGMNQVEKAVSCMNTGAFYFFVKTVDEKRLVKGVRNAITMIELQQENLEMKNRFLADTLVRPDNFEDIITQSKKIRSIFQYIEAVAKGTQPVLITGESGVGKELFARALHRASLTSGPLISVNVAGLDDNVFADTLFGHVRGAFTGAEGVRSGFVEKAQDGTLFLDEIGDLSMPSQVKLLRLLQEGEYYPLGSDSPKRNRARIIVATHQDLTARQLAGEFRKDLYYRLRAHLIHIPPLRDRRDDMPLLVDFFLEEAAKEFNKTKPTVPKELFTLLANYSFPGNIRELKSIIFDAVSVHRSKILSLDVFKKSMDLQISTSNGVVHTSEGKESSIFNKQMPLPQLQDIDELLVNEAMERAEGNQSIASRLLGVSQPALSKRLKKMRMTKIR